MSGEAGFKYCLKRHEENRIRWSPKFYQPARVYILNENKNIKIWRSDDMQIFFVWLIVFRCNREVNLCCTSGPGISFTQLSVPPSIFVMYNSHQPHLGGSQSFVITRLRDHNNK